MFEKLYVERLAEVFDKMPVDHDRSDQETFIASKKFLSDKSLVTSIITGLSA